MIADTSKSTTTKPEPVQIQALANLRIRIWAQWNYILIWARANIRSQVQANLRLHNQSQHKYRCWRIYESRSRYNGTIYTFGYRLIYNHGYRQIYNYKIRASVLANLQIQILRQ